jgi:hypothetical protein
LKGKDEAYASLVIGMEKNGSFMMRDEAYTSFHLKFK